MIEFTRVSKQYAREVYALRDITLSVKKGELIFLAGPSGAGKSTLLKMIAAIERPTSGKLTVSGTDIAGLKPSGLPYLRRNLGLIFQQQKLLLDRNLLANVMLPLIVTGSSRPDAEKRARAALDKVDLLEKAMCEPLELSGGEQQRVAIARAIAKQPTVLLCDEPTGALDSKTGVVVLQAIADANRRLRTTTLVITHNAGIADMADRVLYMADGRIEHSRVNAHPRDAAELSW